MPKLSREFYDKLGDKIATELVEWFNLTNATYRTDLKELNELNFARFRAEMEAGFARADAKLEQRIAEVRIALADLEIRLTRRMFYFWIGQAATTAGLVFGLVKITS